MRFDFGLEMYANPLEIKATTSPTHEYPEPRISLSTFVLSLIE
jgi:hypothetical protein